MTDPNKSDIPTFLIVRKGDFLSHIPTPNGRLTPEHMTNGWVYPAQVLATNPGHVLAEFSDDRGIRVVAHINGDQQEWDRLNLTLTISPEAEQKRKASAAWEVACAMTQGMLPNPPHFIARVVESLRKYCWIDNSSTIRLLHAASGKENTVSPELVTKLQQYVYDLRRFQLKKVGDKVFYCEGGTVTGNKNWHVGTITEIIGERVVFQVADSMKFGEYVFPTVVDYLTHCEFILVITPDTAVCRRQDALEAEITRVEDSANSQIKHLREQITEIGLDNY